MGPYRDASVSVSIELLQRVCRVLDRVGAMPLYLWPELRAVREEVGVLACMPRSERRDKP